jgi:hypothetical protein
MCKFGIQSFLGFHFESWSKIWNSQFPANRPSAEFQQRSSTSIKHISWTIDRIRAHEYPLERRGSPLFLLYSTLGLNPVTIVPISCYLIASCGQDRFDFSIRIVVSRSCWQNRTLSFDMMLQKCTTILFFYHCGWWIGLKILSVGIKSSSIIKMMSIHRTNAHIGFPSMTTCLFLSKCLRWRSSGSIKSEAQISHRKLGFEWTLEERGWELMRVYQSICKVKWVANPAREPWGGGGFYSPPRESSRWGVKNVDM